MTSTAEFDVAAQRPAEAEHFNRTEAAAYQSLLSSLDRALHEESGSLAMLLIEVTNVSELNARLGFEASAAFMTTLQRRLTDALRGRGRISQFRGSSFCAWIKGIRNSGHAQLAADKLLRTVEDTAAAANLRSLPAFLGVALHPLHGSDAADLLRKAQLAAAAARKRFVRIQIFSEDCAEHVLKHWSLGTEFAQALESGELSIFYQPKVRIADRCATGAEVLMRWLRDGKPVAAPDVFIPLAEETGLIQETTWYALSNALRQAAELNGLGVAINVTPAMLHHREFIDMVQSATLNWQTPPERLTVEITEGALIADFDQAIARMAKLRDLGIRLSIDDFGTGYSSLSYFKKIPADELKIDKSFVSHMLQESVDRQLVATIVTLAKQFKLEIVAEGVEDEATLDALASLGCDYAQGYFFSPAVSFKKFCEWLALRKNDKAG